MPEDYIKLRDNFYQENLEKWQSENNDKAIDAKTRKKLYSDAKTKAANIYSKKKPKKKAPAKKSK